jgi:hypothetical protein
MNTLKTVFGKLFKEETTNLASHEVELATIDELKSDVIAYNKALDNYNNDFKAMQSQLRDLSVKYGKLSDVYMTWFSFYNDTEKKANELGIKLPNEIIKLEKDAITNSNVARDMGNKLYKFLQ